VAAWGKKKVKKERLRSITIKSYQRVKEVGPRSSKILSLEKQWGEKGRTNSDLRHQKKGETESLGRILSWRDIPVGEKKRT